MARFTGHAPILLVRDVERAAQAYEEQIGFEVGSFHGEPTHFAILRRDGLHLMLALAPEEAVVPHWKHVESMWNVYFWVDDVDALYDELKGRGAKIDYELCDQPYGVREFGIQDLDGYDIAFGQVMSSSS